MSVRNVLARVRVGLRHPAGWAALLLLLVPFLLCLSLIPVRGFNPDEFEHTHFAWCLSKGLVAHRDYFEHHTPWLQFLLQPLFAVYQVETLPDDAIGFLFAARRAMWFFAGATLLLTALLGRRLAGGVAGLVAALLLGNASIFLSKSLEIRPDVPAAALLTAAVWLAGRGLDAGAHPLWRLLAGACLGAATMFTQKTLFVGPGLAAGALWYALDSRLAQPRSLRLRNLATLAGGALVPLLATAVYFAWKGALGLFVRDNFLVNVRWPGLGPGAFIADVLRQDPILVVLAAAGLALHCRRMRDPAPPRPTAVLVVLSALSLVSALAYHPAVTFHYFLLMLPFLAVLAGEALVVLTEGRRALALGFLAAAGPLLAIALTPVGAGARSTLLGVAVIAAPLVGLLARRRRLSLALAILLAAHSAYPLLRFRAGFARGNWGTLQGLSYVLRNTAPWEPCFDGFSGLGVFRPHAFFHPFQHWHTLAIETPEQRAAILEALESGRVVPKLVFRDLDLEKGAPPGVLAFLDRHYVPTGIEPIRVRAFDNGLGWWRDEGQRWFGWVPGQERAPHVLFDDKWRQPSLEDGLAVRRTRTLRSPFVVPIRRLGRLAVTLRAKADLSAGPFAFELVANGEPLGHWEAVGVWRDYACVAERRQLRPGFNAFELRIAPAHTQTTRSPELAVQFLDLERLEGP